MNDDLELAAAMSSIRQECLARTSGLADRAPSGVALCRDCGRSVVLTTIRGSGARIALEPSPGGDWTLNGGLAVSAHFGGGDHARHQDLCRRRGSDGA